MAFNPHAPDANTRIQACINIWIDQGYIVDSWTQTLDGILVYMIHEESKKDTTLYAEEAITLHEEGDKMHCITVNAHEYYINKAKQ
jgi:hypothetical protein